MRKVFMLFSSALLIYACGGGSQPSTTQTESAPAATTESTPASSSENPSYDPNRGEGKFTAENVTIGATLDTKMAKAGAEIQGVKCSACHRLTEEKLVGPGWKGVTSRRKPEWILNFITNPDPMIDKDPAVQAQLEMCLVRMPNQGLSDEDARNVLEYMRQNDGVK